MGEGKGTTVEDGSPADIRLDCKMYRQVVGQMSRCRCVALINVLSRKEGPASGQTARPSFIRRARWFGRMCALPLAARTEGAAFHSGRAHARKIASPPKDRGESPLHPPLTPLGPEARVENPPNLPKIPPGGTSRARSLFVREPPKICRIYPPRPISVPRTCGTRSAVGDGGLVTAYIMPWMCWMVVRKTQLLSPICHTS